MLTLNLKLAFWKLEVTARFVTTSKTLYHQTSSITFMVIFKISLAGIAQTYLENHDATNSPHHLFAVTTNLFVVTTNYYKPVCSNYKQLQTCLK